MEPRAVSLALVDRRSGRPQRFAFRVRQDDGRGAVRCPGRIGQSRRADLPTVACLGVGGGTLPLFLANRGECRTRSI